ncbi:MAG: T9SS type A sorting domain-containing protein [Bacteroidales bacterium]|nr:T9SS type A sorting domain-containing protein [Bacteroidales bacterium]
MKKTLLLTIALFISAAVFSQNRSIILRETFDSMQLPTGWTTSDNSTENWTISATNRAGGEANELKFNNEPKAIGVSRIITTPVDLTGLSSIVVSFRHFFEKKSASAMIGIATSANNGQTWNSVWTQTYSETGQYNVIKSISTPDMGKANVVFCLYFQGNSTNISNWFFDDFEISSLVTIDAKAQSIDMGDIVPAGDTEISFSIQNTGSEAITSFEAQFKMNGETITESFETELAQYEEAQFTFTKSIQLTPNTYDSEIKITSVNGENDQNTVNNIARKNVRVALNKTQRLPMFEHFSSSTCSSCVPLERTMQELRDNNPGKYVYTKYVMNWPAPGDPYYIEDGGKRKNFYNVGGVPFLAYNGIGRSNKAVTQEELDEIYNSPAFIDIKGSFNTEGNNINVVMDIMSYIDINNVKVHVTINEKTTTENFTYDYGLKEFHHVMMKMYPNAEGSTSDFKAGEYQRFEFSHDMSTTFNEEIEDLEIAVWIQDIDTREILNSRYLYEYCNHPYPVQNLQLTEDNNTISWEAPEKNTPVGYNVYINNELVAENTKELSYTIENADGVYGIEVVAVYENNITSIGAVKQIKSEVSIKDIETNDNVNVYPNPVNDILYIETQALIQTVEIYDVYGRLRDYKSTSLQDNAVVDVEDLKSGIYFVKVKTEKGNIVKRIIKQ